MRELARRALRFGLIEYFPTLETDRPFPDLQELRRRSAYARLPALQGLYLTEASQWHKAWSFVVGGQVVGLVTASRRGEQVYHTEILMRARDAPKGTMEALIIRAATDLKQEGAYELSLGECPFVVGDPPDIRIHPYGHMMSHAYHVQGLYAFKAKFHPQWRPVFLVSRRRLFLPLVDMFFATGCARLFFYTLFHR